MKKLFLLIGLALSLALSSYASIGQVKNLSASGSSVICIPGADDQIITIQNNGSAAVRLSFDGGAAYYTPNSGKPGTNPTPSTGYLLAAGAQVTLSTQPVINGGQVGLHKPIIAIMVTGTTTLDITTDGVLTQYPTT